VDHVPVWSPDGSHLAFQRASGNAAHVVVGSATGGALVETGPGFSPFAGPAVAFSPDGSKLIAWYSDTNSTWLLDPAGGHGSNCRSTRAAPPAAAAGAMPTSPTPAPPRRAGLRPRAATSAAVRMTDPRLLLQQVEAARPSGTPYSASADN
jgi:hypothetical protein